MDHQEALELRAQYSRAMFDLIPLPAFVVDGEVKIHDFNTAAEALLGSDSSGALTCFYGDAVHCICAEEHGCGQSSQCPNCVIRKSVQRAIAGIDVHREYCTAHTLSGHHTAATDWVVTAGLLPYTTPPRVLLLLENVTEMVKLNSWKKTRLVRDRALRSQSL